MITADFASSPCFQELRAAMSFPRALFGPVERSAFLRLASILRCDTGCSPAEFSGDGWIGRFCEVSDEDMPKLSKRSCECAAGDMAWRPRTDSLILYLRRGKYVRRKAQLTSLKLPANDAEHGDEYPQIVRGHSGAKSGLIISPKWYSRAAASASYNSAQRAVGDPDPAICLWRGNVL